MNKQIKIPLLVLGLWIVFYIGYYTINLTFQYPEKILDLTRYYFNEVFIHQLLGIEYIIVGSLIAIFIYHIVKTFKPKTLYQPIVLKDQVEKTLDNAHEGGEKEKMVKLDGIPNEADRIDLSNLPQVNVLKAIKEESVVATKEKTGGLVITFIQKSDEKEFPQKYSKMSGKVLIEAMQKLGLTETEDLQKNWFEYKLTPMRAGYARYIPTKKVK